MARARKMNVYLEGIEDYVKMFDDMSEAAQEILDEAAKEAAEIVLSSAKQNVPVDTGALKSSLDIRLEKTKRETKKAYQVYSKGVSKGGVRYSFAVEGGTKKTPPKPFLRPALDENKENVKKKIMQVIVNRLEAIK